MFAAQKWLQQSNLYNEFDFQEVDKRLMHKSVLPFSVIADFVNLKDPSKRKRSRAIGEAVGHCYWLTDDGKDVQIDLQNRDHNIFFSELLKSDSSFDWFESENLDFNRMTEQLIQHRTAEILSIRTIDQLKKVFIRQNVAADIKEQSLGVLGAALQAWLQ